MIADNFKYPIGKYEPKPFSLEQKNAWLSDIQNLPQLLETEVQTLDETQLETPYRDGGWTVKQLVHHIADSHMNAYIRFKLGLTEDNPTIKPYEEQLWATMEDTKQLPINISLTILHAVHTRWHCILKNITDDQWNRTVVHPEHGTQMTLWFLLGMYAWHSKHHTAHITALKSRKSWQ